jgi:hypothetical protein
VEGAAVKPIHATVPLRTSRGQNEREHHMQRHRRVKAEREAVAWVLRPHTPPSGPVTVLMRRVAPGSKGLDAHDNLPASLKAPVDQVAQWLGRDDSDPSITWQYGQRPGKKGEWLVEIVITAREGPAHAE